MLLEDQCVSISDFRKNVQTYILLTKKHPIYIFSNNKLVAKLIHPSYEDPSTYELSVHFEPSKSAKELLQELRS